eukprot:CAMPEP_0118696080 /NCGR_PEP_ID=MMETSP0800-20121206/13615_1 /TAXON_ID=210618 ORGANISM="Striatella unipunctata, Strain CCMP2910" /NCGR_SAMPLE_ID=MMETSP0800 /ASSEMBLY_ACC=CAM_ASM_000638 /LENGTH=153 /DNA_ID=CAMNT_0006595087 /DNA_START=141 /DNA_END=602 /DNA_ORIENTATION=-
MSAIVAARSTILRQLLARRQQIRFMGGGAVQMPTPQSANATFLGGHSSKPLGWEVWIFFTYAMGAVGLASVTMAPETSIETWAMEEGRIRIENNVAAPAFGTHYANEFMQEIEFNFDSKVADNPFDEEEEDDDDEEEEEEEDDDEEDDDDEEE